MIENISKVTLTMKSSDQTMVNSTILSHIMKTDIPFKTKKEKNEKTNSEAGK